MKFKQSDTTVPRSRARFLISHSVLLSCAVVTALLANQQVPGLCNPDETQKPAQPQQLPQSAQPSQGSAKKPSQADILIVQLSDSADREKFDDLLQEVHGTLINTLDFGKGKLLVIQTEPGKAAEVEKKFSKSKEVSRVQRNQTYHIDDYPVSAGANQAGAEGLFKFGHLPKVHAPNFHEKIGFGKFKFGFGFGHHGFTLPPSGSPPPPSSPPLTGVPDDPLFSQQWDATFMNFVQARDSGAPTMTGVAIYFLDTGLSPPASDPNEYSPLTQQRDFSGINPTGNPENLYDSGTHGTATSSVTIATDNGIGYAGLANLEFQRCNLTMCRISQDGMNASTLNILAALNFLYQSPNLPPGPVNISFNAAPPNTLNADPSVQMAAQQLASKGFLVVLAAGNDGMQDSSPEQYARRVAAIGPNGLLANFSNFGPFPYAAPGVNVPVYSPSGAASGSGTSFAAPRWCAAIVDVMGALPPGLRTAPYADQIIRQTAITTSQNYAVPNLVTAVQAAAGM